MMTATVQSQALASMGPFCYPYRKCTGSCSARAYNRGSRSTPAPDPRFGIGGPPPPPPESPPRFAGDPTQASRGPGPSPSPPPICPARDRPGGSSPSPVPIRVGGSVPCPRGSGSSPQKSDLRNHQAIVQPRLYDCLMVTQITLIKPGTPRVRFLPGTLFRKSVLLRTALDT